jgi:hypothetical protein
VVVAREEFAKAGYVVLRAFFAPSGLSDELDRALADGAASRQSFPAGSGSVSLRYVPMMGDRTPVSLELTGALADLAAELLARPVLPGRSKGTRYYGNSSWHRDSDHDVSSLGCVAYLDPMSDSNGALRVLPGSHRDRELPLPQDDAVAGTALVTQPGDVIVFDECLIHGSIGGGQRRQWRTDFIAASTGAELTTVRNWFGQNPDCEDDPGYDPRTYPSYGAAWRRRYPAWTAQLVALGVIHEDG